MDPDGKRMAELEKSECSMYGENVQYYSVLLCSWVKEEKTH
jgi:hypothetical protein